MGLAPGMRGWRTKSEIDTWLWQFAPFRLPQGLGPASNLFSLKRLERSVSPVSFVSFSAHFGLAIAPCRDHFLRQDRPPRQGASSERERSPKVFPHKVLRK